MCPGATFSIQILEKLPGDGYLNGKLDSAMLQLRLEKENFWIKTLRSVYPYGLNERVKSMNKEVPTGKLFPPLPRHGTRFVGQRIRSTTKARISDLDSLVHTIFSFSKEERSNKCRILFDRLRHANLRKLAEEASLLLSSCEDHLKRWYELLIDVFLTKTMKDPKRTEKKSPKFILPIYFHNKGLEFIQLKNILRKPNVMSKLPEILQDEDPPSVVYSLSSTIRNKIFNYKETVDSIDTANFETFGTNLSACTCSDSPFVDPDHGHILTGDLRILKNPHLRKLISKGPNYREPKNINLNKCRESILNGINSFIDTTSAKINEDNTSFTLWKDEVIGMVEAKIASLKRKIKFNKVSSILKRQDVVDYLNELHSKFVIVPIDKAANNVAFICKRFYVEVILREIGIISRGNETYVKIDRDRMDIVDENVSYSKRLGFTVSDKDLDLPSIYWTPKKHKHPTGKRFIIASKHCSTKLISKSISLVFKLIYRQIENFHTKSKFLSNYNKFWVLQNCDPVLESLNRINKKKNAKSISTFDFSTLYTKIPHDKLIKELAEVIDFVFDAGSSKYIAISQNDKAYWSRTKPKSSISFSKSSLKTAVKHLIKNCFFKAGNVVMCQVIGIPMGIDPAPFWANLFLYQYEQRYMTQLIEQDKVKARHFHSTKRFIDDLCAVNDGNMFESVYREIYPDELELKVEHSGSHASFLNLDISIKDGVFVYKLFDKRDAFPFSIVRMPHIDSNMPESIFYSSFVGEFLRIARSTLLFEDLREKSHIFIQRMRAQGATVGKLDLSLRRVITRHNSEFSRFQLSLNSVVHQLLR